MVVSDKSHLLLDYTNYNVLIVCWINMALLKKLLETLPVIKPVPCTSYKLQKPIEGIIIVIGALIILLRFKNFANF